MLISIIRIALLLGRCESEMLVILLSFRSIRILLMMDISKCPICRLRLENKALKVSLSGVRLEEFLSTRFFDPRIQSFCITTGPIHKQPIPKLD